MRKELIIIAVIFLLNTPIFPQVQKGATELSLSGSLGSYSISYENKYYHNDGDSKTYFLAVVRAGFFVTNSLEIEPELNILAQDETGVNIGVNLAYNFDLSESNIYPFLMAGLGVGNSYVIFNVPGKGSDSFDVIHFNIGAGMKIMINDYVATRIEYRYRQYNNNTDDTDITYNTHNLLFGFSFFL